MSILNIPIQINGGTDKNTTGAKQLKHRELYINTSSYNLYCGNENGVPVKVNCGRADTATMADSAVCIGGSNSFININANRDIDLDNTIAGARIGQVIFYNDRCEPRYNKTIRLKDFGLQNVKSLTLSSSVYGTSLPQTAVTGQVFFLI